MRGFFAYHGSGLCRTTLALALAASTFKCRAMSERLTAKSTAKAFLIMSLCENKKLSDFSQAVGAEEPGKPYRRYLAAQPCRM
jgi:hypothetical protein